MSIVATLLALSFAATDASDYCQPDTLDAQTPGYFAGTYDVIGRDSWTGRPFTGRAIISVSDTLNVTWRYARRTISAIARTEHCGMDHIRILHVVFREHGTDMDGLCFYTSELDNYPRITCQLRGAKNARRAPGMLALFFHHDDPT